MSKIGKKSIETVAGVIVTLEKISYPLKAHGRTFYACAQGC